MPQIVACLNCTATFAVPPEGGPPMRMLCQTCYENHRAEAAAHERMVGRYKKELDKFVTGQYRGQEARVKELESQLEESRRRCKATEQSHSDLCDQISRNHRENAYFKEVLELWKQSHQHEVSGSCVCTARRPCNELAALREAAMSETPEYKCPKCETNEPAFAAMKSVIEKAYEALRHYCEVCEKTGIQSCAVRKDLIKEALDEIRLQGDRSLGNQFLKKMKNGLHDFSFLGEGIAILYLHGRYNLVSLDLNALRERGVELTLLSVESSPKAAVERYYATRKKKDPHVVPQEA